MHKTLEDSKIKMQIRCKKVESIDLKLISLMLENSFWGSEMLKTLTRLLKQFEVKGASS